MLMLNWKTYYIMKPGCTPSGSHCDVMVAMVANAVASSALFICQYLASQNELAFDDDAE